MSTLNYNPITEPSKRLTEEDFNIHAKYNWKLYEQERLQPANMTNKKDGWRMNWLSRV